MTDRYEQWDTDEAFNILKSDEGLYTIAMLQPDGRALKRLWLSFAPSAAELRRAMGVGPEKDVPDPAHVDWNEVYNDLHNIDSRSLGELAERE